MEREIRRKALFYGFAAILLVSAMATVLLDFGDYTQQLPASDPPVPVLQSAFLSTFSSYDELKDCIASKMGTQGYYPFYGRATLWLSILPTFGGSRGDLLLSPTATLFGIESQTFDYSTTNVQVEGVDEADVVKTDGEYLYVLSGDSVVIVRAYPSEKAEVVHQMSFNGIYPLEFYVSSNKLVVLGLEKNLANKALFEYAVAGNYIKTQAHVYDIDDKEHPVLLRNLTVTGGYFNSRMIGDYVYFTVSQPAWLDNDTIALPIIHSNNQAKEILATEVHRSDATESSYDFTSVFAVNVMNTTEAPTYLTLLLGGACNIYASRTNMYLTFPNAVDNTSIYRMHLQGSNLACEASGNVVGRELNQFSMDEYNDHFRIVTRSWVNGFMQTNLYVLDMNLTVVGRLEGLGMNENLHSSRFMGDRCYLVTFKKVDPLFVINLADPKDPTVLGELKIPGYSDYLHPYDETHIIGVGKETVEAVEGDFAWYQGIKISLFDVSNVSNPIQVDVFIIGQRGSNSPVLTNHKAFLFDKERELLVIPVLVAEVDITRYPTSVPPNAYGTPVWQGAYVLRITKNGIELRGRITHGEGSGVPDTDHWVTRALYIADILYTVSQKKVKLNALSDLELLKELEFP